MSPETGMWKITPEKHPGRIGIATWTCNAVSAVLPERVARAWHKGRLADYTIMWIGSWLPTVDPRCPGMSRFVTLLLGAGEDNLAILSILGLPLFLSRVRS